MAVRAKQTITRQPRSRDTVFTQLAKTATGIRGFDEITYGGLPKGRPALVAGRAGSGKTLFAMEFLVRGATEFNEPGVLMSFEETSDELIKNFSSLGFDLSDLIAHNRLAIDYVTVEREHIEETGEYDLEGLFVRLDYAIKQVNAKRIVLDTIEALFSGLKNEAILRAELRRLFRWLKSRGVTAVITGERGKDTLTRHGLEEYVADCVVVLDHTVTERVATRRMRILKYRGSFHGMDEYPFLITERGLSVLPLTSSRLEHSVTNERVSTGVPRLDAMLGGEGYYKGTSVLVSGTPGTGKSTLAAHFARAACDRGERVLYFAFEEAPNQIVRNMQSVGLDLSPCLKSGTLRIDSRRPTMWGLELHLASIHREIVDFQPAIVIIDPISNLTTIGTQNEVRSMLIRLVDFIKNSGITSLYTELLGSTQEAELTRDGVSSLMDTWVILEDLAFAGERNRGIYVRKARGISHSNQVREFLLTEKGIDIVDVYSGPEGVLTGTARVAQEARARAEREQREQDLVRKQRELQRKEEVLNAQISVLRNQFEIEQEDLRRVIEEDARREEQARDIERRITGMRDTERPRETSKKGRKKK